MTYERYFNSLKNPNVTTQTQVYKLTRELSWNATLEGKEGRGGAGQGEEGRAELRSPPSIPASLPPAFGRPGAALRLLAAEPGRPRGGLHLPPLPGGGAGACPRPREEMEAAAAGPGGGGRG